MKPHKKIALLVPGFILGVGLMILIDIMGLRVWWTIGIIAAYTGWIIYLLYRIKNDG